MKIISEAHATDHLRRDIAFSPIRDGLFLDHIGGELRGLYGDVEAAPLPDTLCALMALLDLQTDPETDRET